MGDVTPDSQGTIAQRLEWLIQHKHPAGRGPYSNQEITQLSKGLAEDVGAPSISSPQSVWNIRTGKVTNPGIDSLRALAAVFEVPVSFFVASTPQERAEPGVEVATLTVRLNHLFDHVCPKGRGPYSNQEVAAGVSARGAQMSEGDVAALRSGQADTSWNEYLPGLAAFFGVPMEYFLDDAVAAKVSQELVLLGALGEVGARRVALRAFQQLSDDAVEALIPMIEHLGKSGKGRM